MRKMQQLHHSWFRFSPNQQQQNQQRIPNTHPVFKAQRARSSIFPPDYAVIPSPAFFCFSDKMDGLSALCLSVRLRSLRVSSRCILTSHPHIASSASATEPQPAHINHTDSARSAAFIHALISVKRSQMKGLGPPDRTLYAG